MRENGARNPVWNILFDPKQESPDFSETEGSENQTETAKM